ncbi:hypothetical protein HDU76_000269 [Blyttiomyces sp. JEL0837]|nr:hypothetical protein HDU76_000269 [Blyttiomyces sp. JEL0837]
MQASNSTNSANNNFFSKFINSMRKANENSSNDHCPAPRPAKTFENDVVEADVTPDTIQDQHYDVYKLPRSNPREVGQVKFDRNLDMACHASNGKPIFLQFQEIPGCRTCTSWGDNILTPPLQVEFFETFFTPVAIHNNSNIPSDLQVMKKFGEPSWNNPVVRILDSHTQTDIIPRLDGIYNTAGVIGYAISGLVKHFNSKVILPSWVDFMAVAAGLHLSREASGYVIDAYPIRRESATFFMGCYWQGEVVLGDIAGVVSTWPGWCDGVEVVEVVYDADVVSFEEIVKVAVNAGFGVVIHDETQKRSVIASFGTRARMNSLIGSGGDILQLNALLTPRQRHLLDRIANRRIQVPFVNGSMEDQSGNQMALLTKQLEASQG